ncbi:MAG: hypothetical protein ACHQO8_04390, partial [Vicinamibacterales bacterium]
PLRPRTVTAAKLLALGAYVGILVVGMHGLASLTFGLLLGNFGDVTFALRGVLAHFLAASLGSAFVFLAVAALQGTLLVVLGPRLFTRVSAVGQLLLILAVLAGLIALPTISASSIQSLEAQGVRPLVVHQRSGRVVTIHPTTGTGSIARAWVPYTPPIWFLGVYETTLGTTEPRLRQLAATGIGATLGALLLVLITHPLAYRRMAVAAVETADAGAARRARLTRGLPALLAREPTARASIQFFLSTVARVERHRFVIAMAGGIAAAFAIPLAVSSIGVEAPVQWSAPPRWATVQVLAVPFSVMTCLAVGLRIAAQLPGDARASWIFHVIDADGWRARAGLWRVVYVLAVLPIEVTMAVVAWRVWGAAFAAANLAVGLVAGAGLVELLLRRMRGMPCAAPWRPQPGHLRAWWPVYFFGFLIFTTAAPALALLSLRSLGALGVALAIIAAATLAMRISSRRSVVVEQNDDDAPKLEVLSLN